MPQNVYECMFILDANKYARDPGRVSGAVPEIIKNVGGEILADRLWTEQKLAYPIKGHRKGTYWLTYFKLDGNKLRDFNRLCRLNDSILRNLVLKIDSRLVDALVSHALGETKKAARGDSEAPDTVAKTDDDNEDNAKQ